MQKDGCQVSRSSCPQNASLMGHVTKGSKEKVCQHSISGGKSGFQKRVLDILSQMPKGSPQFNPVEEYVGDRENTILWYQSIIPDLQS